ncbi:unnamed protein product [Coregonus sp. 'balchen']|nr:unnamed protein product [Coregonus sp. 'balchen']
MLGTRFQIQAARDPDIALNSVRLYKLSQNDHFEIEIRDDEDKIPFLVLKKALDRELKTKHRLLVTAVDGGSPQRSGTVNVTINVLDSNDNRPVCSQDTYSVRLRENAALGTLVARVNATDLDEGSNGELEYTLGRNLKRKVYDIFELDSLTGEIKVKVSALFLISIIVLIVMQCSKPTDYSSKYLQDVNYDGTLCHSIQYRSGDKRYMLVGPRMSTGSTIVPGSNGNTLVLPEHRRASGEVRTGSKHFNRSCFVACLRMGDGRQRRRREYWWVALRFSLLLCFGEQVSAQIRYSIPEEVKEGSVVGNVAKDLGLDVSTLIERRFRIVSGSEDAIFQVNQNNGVLYVHKNIDREELCDGNSACLINLKLVVENPLEVHYVGLEITDINDHSPSFSEKDIHLKIAENKLPGARFELQTARDLDSGINSIRIYKLNQNEHFDLELRDSGEGYTIPLLVLQKALDREQKTEHVLLLTALDGGNPPRSGTVNITVTVLDTNDNQPVCSQDVYSVTLQENSDIGRTILTINATDADYGSNGEVEYTLGRNLKRRVHEIFQLVSVTGEIRVKGPVDFEENEVYRLNIEASDKGQPPLTVDCRVIIKIIDVNDNIPDIDVTSLSNTVPEDTKPGTVISLISVTDKDAGINGKVICSISEDVPFELKPSFQDNVYSIVTKGRLDRELVSHYDITITATDCGQPPLSTFKTLSVQISDVNDNTPEFSQTPLELYLVENNAPGLCLLFCLTMGDGRQRRRWEYWWVALRFSLLLCFGEQVSAQIRYSIPEEVKEGSVVGNVAKDLGLDVSTLVERRFRIVSESDEALFQVNQNNGVLYVRKNIDREELCDGNGVCSIDLKVVVENPLEVHYVGVEITDVNDHSPIFAEKYLHLDIAENTLSGTRFELQTARDADVGVNSVRMYKLISTLFLISIIVLIVMQCSKTPDYSSKYLQDVNYDGTLCHSIQYKSGDKRYMLVGPRMSIGSTIVPGSNGNTLVLPDHRRPASGENVSLLLCFGEKVSAQIRYSIPEEVKEGSIVGNVAKDLDLDVSTLVERRFRIVNQNNGALYVHKNIDREELCDGNNACLINLKIAVENPLEIHYVSIEITDINDHSPIFPEKDQYLEMPENTFPSARFELQTARDVDVGINSVHLYKLGQNAHFELQLIDSGEGDKIPFLILQKQLDREQNTKHMLLLTALDGGNPPKSGTLNITVTVLDVNDNRPICSQDEYSVTLPENALNGTIVLRVNATDADDGPNGAVEYTLGRTIKRKIHDIFELDHVTGEIQVKGQVDFEVKEVYRLNVQASDKGQPPTSVDCRVIIKIGDVNDNEPEIDVTSLYNTVSEDSKPGTVISLISVTDKDSGINGKVIASISEDIPFELKPSFQENVYSIATKGRLDRELVSHYDITITAIDCGQPPLSTFKTLSVQISDVNDNSPEFSPKTLELYLVENNVPATVKINVVEPKEAFAASDVKSSVKDEEENFVTFYLIITLGSVSALFLISIIVLIVMQCSKTTEHSSKYLQDVNYDGTLCHSIQYRSGDKRYMLVGPRMSTGSTIVPGSNGNTLVLPEHRSRASGERRGAPLRAMLLFVFLLCFCRGVYCQIRYSIAEESKEGTYVGDVAKDLGFSVDKLAERRFRIVSGSKEGLLQINQDNGVLYVNRNIDREELCEKSIMCLINLKTVAENPLEIHYVEVEITDMNDHSPKFPEKVKHLEISESVMLQGTRFPLDAARDPDVGANSLGKYTLSTNENFELDVKTRGEDKIPFLILKKPLDREHKPEILLTLTAYDGGKPERSGSVNITVKVIDMNDNIPVFDRQVYTLTLDENAPLGTSVLRLHATDLDDGANGQVIYSFDKSLKNKAFDYFEIDAVTGEITIKGLVDFEEQTTATVIINVVEPKEAFAASDVKSAVNYEEENSVTFYLIITLGSVIVLFLISIIVLIVMQCSKTPDYSSKYLQDVNYDGTLCHSIQYRSGDKRYMLVGPRMSTGSTIVPGSNGNTLVLPEHRRRASGEIRYSISEELKEGAVVGNIAKDLGVERSTLKERGFRIVSGSTETLFQVNQNDGIFTNGSAEGVEEIPRNVNAGHLVTKVRAYDADIGYNGWLLFSLQEVTDHSLFALDRYTGQIRTLRSFTETDEAEHKLVILVKDNGNVSLSATATVKINVVEPKEAFAASDVESSVKDEEENFVTFYLIITLGSVSALFLISIIVLIVMQCSKTPDYSSKYLQDVNYDGTLCHSIQYRSGDKRYMLVGPRMSTGSTIVPGSNGNTLVLPDHRRASGERTVMVPK